MHIFEKLLFFSIFLSRYLTIVPYAVPHMTTCNTELDGHIIPEGTMVWPNLWELHHDEKVWGDPFVFRPERYLDESGCLVAADHPVRKHNLVFSAGPRVCPGEVFAMSRMFLMLATLIQSFEILPGTTLAEQASCDCRDMVMGLVMMPPPCYVRFISREKE